MVRCVSGCVAVWSDSFPESVSDVDHGLCWLLLVLDLPGFLGCRLVPLICSHLLLAILAREYCNDALYNMRVGAKVLDLFPQTVRSASGESFVNDPMLLSGAWDALKIEGDEVTCQGWAADVRIANWWTSLWFTQLPIRDFTAI